MKNKIKFFLVLGFFLFTNNAFAADVVEGQYLVERTANTQNALSASLAGYAKVFKHKQNFDVLELNSANNQQNLNVNSSYKKKVVKYNSQEDRCQEIMAKDPSITSCSPNFVRHTRNTPNDSRFSEMWGLRNSQNGIDIAAEAAWNLTQGSKSVVVAVLDTGVDYNHPDLQANMWKNPGEIPGNRRDDDNDGFVDNVYGVDTVANDGDPMDQEGHGTHVAGTIGAAGNNSRGVVGINWNVSIIAARFLDENGGSLDDEIEAIDYLVNLKRNKGVNIVAINASFGSYDSFSQSELNALNRAKDAGILLIAAAGNESLNNDRENNYPANYDIDNVISVAALSQDGNMSNFSNYGANSVDLAAPGEEILSSIPNNNYDFYSGTSMATPHVVGAAALVASYRPDLNYLGIRSALLNNTRQLNSLSGKVKSGGLLNLYGALTGTVNTTPPSTPPSTPPTDNPPADTPPPSSDNEMSLDAFAKDGSTRVKAKKTFYLELASSSDKYANLYLTIDGTRCSSYFELELYADYVDYISAKFSRVKKQANVTFTLESDSGSRSSSLTVVPAKKSKKKNKINELCSDFFKTARYAN